MKINHDIDVQGKVTSTHAFHIPNWSPVSRAYYEGDIVYYGEQIFVCTSTHTSGPSFNSDPWAWTGGDLADNLVAHKSQLLFDALFTDIGSGLYTYELDTSPYNEVAATHVYERGGTLIGPDVITEVKITTNGVMITWDSNVKALPTISNQAEMKVACSKAV